MKRLILPVISLLLLAGCSSWQSKFSGSVEPVNLSGGAYDGQDKSFYWLTRALSSPRSASDYVQQPDRAWYKSSYQWQDGTLKEIVREGEMRQPDQSLKPFLVHIRFSADGEAIYQRYRVDNQILPLNQSDLKRYSQDADNLVEKVDDLNSQGLSLVQGVWDGNTFESCDGVQYKNVDYQEASLPITVVERLNDFTSYAAFIGTRDKKSKTVVVNNLLVLDKASHGCIERSHLILK
ncbi:DUF1481 domain-containing protein [Vibrio rumoiensis]|uniref:Peptidylprolyl isomerase n=1 Tax=Vibrio rumoiensis 1S-45 TaxID=1188252 RepID=A0A1E5E697_9VIBR|nr:DUF1481 domain-containing protein [Vibrio rumoiensis]OEF29384.1 hypothetical protein A1QC_03810 [Vibrio rumoiensis 1S-45]